MIHSYSSIYNLGHRAVADLLNHDVIVEEKVDGSQFSFMKSEDGTLSCRSKGAQINMEAPEGMFELAVEKVREMAPAMRPGYVYRGEYLSKPKHNVLAYDRVPKNNIIIFDITTGDQQFCSPEFKRMWAAELNLETVKVLHTGRIADINDFRSLLDTESVLGGQKIEGVVIKPASYNLFGADKKVLMGKFVSEAFREVHAQTWTKEHKDPGVGDIVQILSDKYRTTARWQKAVIHLKERGALQNSQADIGPLMKEVPEDVLKECRDEIKEELFKALWPKIRRTLAHGLPEWWKEELLKSQFENQKAA